MLVTALGVAVPLALFVLLATEAWQKDVSTWDARVSRALQGYEERGVIDSRLDVFDLILHPAVHIAGPDSSSCAFSSSWLLEDACGRR